MDKKMKKILLFLTACLVVSSAEAQITTGKSTSHVVRTGNRAEEGNLGLYIGATSDMFFGLGDESVRIEALPLLNFKYMATDELEWRCGIEWFKKSSTVEATQDVSSSNSKFLLSPGLAYHFDNRNLLDVYIGGELPIGWGSIGGDNGSDDWSTGYFRFGLGAFIGLQAFIGNLPVAMGIEYGLGLNYQSVSDGVFSDDDHNFYYDNQSIKFWDDIDVSKFFMGNQVRLTLSYYFDL